MVARELIYELNSVQSLFDWKLQGNRKQIRARIKNSNKRFAFDPVTAVCFSRTGKAYREDEWFKASTELDLTSIDSGDLNAAANNVNSPYSRGLRNDLLATLNLDSKPETASERLKAFMSLFHDRFKRRSVAT